MANCKIRAVALPYMRELRTKLKETIDLSVLYDNKRVCIERQDGVYEVKATDIPGKPSLLHASASGKLFFAYMAEEQRDKLIDEMNLVRYTSNTITNRQELRQQLEKIRTQGFSCSYEELTEMVNAVAAPIRDRSGEVIASLSIWGLVTHFSRDKMNECTALIISAAKRISVELGYRDESSGL